MPKAAEWKPVTFDDLIGQPVARCNKCGRVTFTANDAGAVDRMPQPDGHPCGGTFVPSGR